MLYIPTKLRLLRELFGYSQSAVAFTLNVAQSTYFRYENNMAKLDADQLEVVSRFYGLSLSEFLELEPKQLILTAIGREIFIKSRIRGGGGNLWAIRTEKKFKQFYTGVLQNQ